MIEPEFHLKLKQEYDLLQEKIKMLRENNEFQEYYDNNFTDSSKSPNIQNLEKVKGYHLSQFLELADSSFLNTLNVLNYFVDKIETQKCDIQKKSAQLLILSGSLTNRPAFNTLEEKLKEISGSAKITKKEIVKRVFQMAMNPVIPFHQLADVDLFGAEAKIYKQQNFE